MKTKRFTRFLIAFIIVALILPQGLALAVPLWQLPSTILFPGSVSTTGQTSKIFRVWLGKQSLGNGDDWMQVDINLNANSNRVTVEVEKKNYTYIAFSCVSRMTHTQVHYMNNNQMTGASYPGEYEYYSSNGQITPRGGIAVFKAELVVFPLNVSGTPGTTSTYRLYTHQNGGSIQNFYIDFVWI
jgi:hypothetical protein